jgi:hypothetical protein
VADEIVGVEATREVIKDVRVLATRLITRAKDGVGIDDAIALATDSEVRAAAISLCANVKKLKAEAGDLSLDEGVSLIPDVTALIIEIIKAAK